MSERSTRTAKLDLRLTPEAKRRLQMDAETLADRIRFGLDADHWSAFPEALDAPPRDLPRVRRLLFEPGVFEREAGDDRTTE